jgi:hypothetical protein
LNARWMQSLYGFLHGIEWITFHGHLDYFQKPSLGDKSRSGSNTNPGDHGTPTHSQPIIYYNLSCVRTRMNENSLK